MGIRDYVNHGRRHSPGGSDPISGFIAFDTENVGGWLDITANDQDSDTYGIQLVDASAGGIVIKSDDGAGAGGPVLVFSANNDVNVKTDNSGDINIETLESGDINLYTNGGNNITIDARDSGYIYVGTTETTEVDVGHTNCTVEIGADMFTLDAVVGIRLRAAYTGVDVGVYLYGTSAGSDFIVWDGAGTPAKLFEVRGNGEIFAHLPTSAGTSGSLWNDGGTVKVA